MGRMPNRPPSSVFIAQSFFGPLTFLSSFSQHNASDLLRNGQRSLLLGCACRFWQWNGLAWDDCHNDSPTAAAPAQQGTCANCLRMSPAARNLLLYTNLRCREGRHAQIARTYEPVPGRAGLDTT